MPTPVSSARPALPTDRPLVRAILAILAVAWLGLAAAQVPSGDPSPFIEAEIEVDAEVDLPGGSTEVKGTINVNTDGIGTVIDAVIGALCRIFPCAGDDDEQTQALRAADAPRIGDARTGIVLQGGAIGVGEFFTGIVTEESAYEWGFSVRFARDADVRVRSLTFTRDAFLTQAYLDDVGMDGRYYVAAGTYYVVDRKLTVPVLRQRD
jgi:hypothetical protein